MTIVSSALHRSRDTVRPALRTAIARLDPTTRALASYHLGWTDQHGNDCPDSGGKAVRAALALLSAEAAGAPAQVGLPGAVAVELVHNFSLLHDDLMDGDAERRHRPTVWAIWGPSSGILTGDALLALSQEVLFDEDSPQSARAARLLAQATRELVRGQVDDLAFERRDDVGLAECLDMAAGKTGALMSASAAIGAVLAGGGPDLVEALAGYGAHVGIAFQLVDDLLGIWGEPAVTGKPVWSDLRARKKSLPVTYALTHGGPARDRLAAWLADPAIGVAAGGGVTFGGAAPPIGSAVSGDGAVPGTGEVSAADEELLAEADLRRVADLLEAAGARRWAEQEARRRVETANASLREVSLPEAIREELTTLAMFLINREA